MPQLCESYKDIWFAIRWKDKFLVERDKNIRDERGGGLIVTLFKCPSLNCTRERG